MTKQPAKNGHKTDFSQLQILGKWIFQTRFLKNQVKINRSSICQLVRSEFRKTLAQLCMFKASEYSSFERLLFILYHWRLLQRPNRSSNSFILEPNLLWPNIEFLLRWFQNSTFLSTNNKLKVLSCISFCCTNFSVEFWLQKK